MRTISSEKKINILLFITCLAIIDFGGISIYIMSFIGVAICVLFPSQFRRCISTKRFLAFSILCILSTMLYCLNVPNVNRTFVAGNVLMPLNMYICGYSIINGSKFFEFDFKKTIFTVALSSGLYAIITSMNKGDVSQYSNYSAAYMNNIMRQSYSLWNGNLIRATVLSVFLIPLLAILFYCFVCMRGIKRVLCSICGLLAVFSAFQLGSRASFVIILCSITISIIILLKQLRSSSNSNKLFLRVMLVLLLLLLGFGINLFGVRDKILSSTLFYRFSIMDGNGLNMGGRDDILEQYLSLLLKHPFGGLALDTGVSTHNTLLQYGAYGGAICLIIAVLFWITFLLRVVRSAMKDTSKYIYISIPLAVSIFLIFMVESVVLSNATMYSAFVMLYVAIDQFYRRKDNREKNNCENV